jgi:hypothetical protein
MALNWYKTEDDKWFDLFRINLEKPDWKNIKGVYIIFSFNPSISVIKVGSGVIIDKFVQHKNELTIKAFSAHGCYVTWAKAPEFLHHSIVMYLNKKLNPALQSETPRAISLKVNLPW